MAAGGRRCRNCCAVPGSVAGTAPWVCVFVVVSAVTVVAAALPATSAALPLTEGDWHDLQQLASLSLNSLAQSGLPQFEGSNAWAIAGTHTASGKPLLAGDPHIRFAAPAVW